MFFYVDTAKRKRINHAKRSIDFEELPLNEYKTILPGEKCLVFCNGTIGQGRIAYNYKKEDAIKMLKGLIKKLQN